MNATNTTDVPVVVYACRKNAGRSLAARVLTEHYAGNAVTALSAGTEPGDELHPEMVAALTGLGLDTSREVPKRLTREMIAGSDVAITLGCGEACPVVPGVPIRDWPVDDPAGQDPQTVRRIVADLDNRVRSLLSELLAGRELPPSVLGPTPA